MVLNLLTLKSVVTDIIKSLSNCFSRERTTAQPDNSRLLNKPEIIVNLHINILMIFPTNGLCSNFGAFVLLLGVLCLTKLFFFCMRESEENRSMLWNDKGSAVKFNVMLLILFLWRGRSSSGVII